MDYLAQLIDYENGHLDLDQTIELFQALIDSGQIWCLQGHYQRMAETLVHNGYCTWSKRGPYGT